MSIFYIGYTGLHIYIYIHTRIYIYDAYYLPWFLFGHLCSLVIQLCDTWHELLDFPIERCPFFQVILHFAMEKPNVFIGNSSRHGPLKSHEFCGFINHEAMDHITIQWEWAAWYGLLYKQKLRGEEFENSSDWFFKKTCRCFYNMNFPLGMKLYFFKKQTSMNIHYNNYLPSGYD